MTESLSSSPAPPNPVRHQFRHAIDLPIPPAEAFPLFTPLGEKLWVAGWDPHPVHPADGQLELGMVFTTRHTNDPDTIWWLGACEPDRRLRYLRVTPGSRLAVVDVELRAVDAGTRVDVTYTFTALSQAGREVVNQLEDGGYARYIDSWREAISAYLNAAATPGSG